MENLKSKLSWSDFKLNSDGMVPVIVQDYKTDQVLMLAYMNEEANLFACELSVKGKIGTSSKIHCAEHQALIHRKNAASVAADSLLVSHCFFNGSAKDDSRVLDGVVIVHLKIPFHLHIQVKQSVAGKAVQHVDKKEEP